MGKFCGIKDIKKLEKAIKEAEDGLPKESAVEVSEDPEKIKENELKKELKELRERLTVLEKASSAHEKSLKFLDEVKVIKHLKECEERIRTLSQHVQLSFLKLMVCTEVSYCDDKIWPKIVLALENCDDKWWQDRNSATINGWIHHLNKLESRPSEKS